MSKIMLQKKESLTRQREDELRTKVLGEVKSEGSIGSGKSVGSIGSVDQTQGCRVLDSTKLLLDKTGLSLERVLERYKRIIDTPNVKYKGSDVVKVLENLTKLHGLEDKTEQDKATAQLVSSLQGKSIDEIRVTLIEITTKSRQYLERMDKVEDATVIGQSSPPPATV